jgi:hypothetical protein
MSLTAERLDMLNKDSTNKIAMEIEDLEDNRQHALGTRVYDTFSDSCINCKGYTVNIMKCAGLLMIVLLYMPFVASGQEYSYSQYDSRDGLAGSTVYCMTQDKEGFIWFGTETGLSRFDGTHFKNFSTDDGLPSNDIIKLFPTRKAVFGLHLSKKRSVIIQGENIYPGK